VNHIADVPGLRVGHASDHAARTGSTVVVFDEPAVCAVDVRGGAPGTRETDALRPGGLSPPVDAVCLSGGSAFGLAAGDGAQRALLARGRGFSVREQRIPIVPAAILFDLEGPPADFAAFGAAAVEAAFVGSDTALGTIGAGVNATTAGLKGGIGAALEILPGAAVGALVAVNAVGFLVRYICPGPLENRYVRYSGTEVRFSPVFCGFWRTALCTVYRCTACTAVPGGREVASPGVL